MKTKLLFVCSGNRDRSPTAEALYRSRPRFEVQSAGTSKYADTMLTKQEVQWADIIVVMEPCHEVYIRENFHEAVEEKVIFRLNIPDRYHFMDTELIRLIDEKMDILLDRFFEKHSLPPSPFFVPLSCK
jgi:predicted protein tyrosine phosphatase